MAAIDNNIYADALKRRDGESRFEYHKRLLTAKLIDKTIDADYGSLSPYLYGRDYAPDVARRMAYGSMKTIELMENESMTADSGLREQLDRQLTDIRIERQKLSDYRAAVSKTVRERARQEELRDMIVSAIRESDLPELSYTQIEHERADNDLLITLNDIHYGLDVNNKWCVYNSDVCRDMMCRYLDEILRIRDVHGSENCTVVCAGDCISGNIHYSIAVQNRENVIDQVIGVSELIAEFLAVLARHFCTVRFVSVSGNHSRLNPNKELTVDAERLDDLVGWYLDARLQNIENITIDADSRIDPPMAEFSICGKKYCCVHGDYDGSAEKVQTLKSMVGGDLYAVISGHLHHNATDVVQGVRTIAAGSFVGMDDYCVRKRIISEPEQMVCVCTSKGLLCPYPVSL